MREAPAIAEAAAIAVPDEMRREEVLVLLKLAEGSVVSDMPPAAVGEHSTRLAAFKRPRYVAYVDEFPRTPTNKIAKPSISLADLSGPVTDLQNGVELSDDDAQRLIGR